MNSNHTYFLKQLIDKDTLTPIKLPKHPDKNISFNSQKKLDTLNFMNLIFKINNYSNMWQKVYKEAGVVVNTKTGEYFYKVNFADTIDLILNAFVKTLYYESLEPGGLSQEKYFTSNELLHYLHQFGVLTNSRNVDHKLKKHVKDGMIARHDFNDLEKSIQQYIKSGLINNRLPVYVYSLGQKAFDIDKKVLEDEDCILTLTKVCDKSAYLKIMTDAINTLPDEERHKVIDQINP